MRKNSVPFHCETLSFLSSCPAELDFAWNMRTGDDYMRTFGLFKKEDSQTWICCPANFSSCKPQAWVRKFSVDMLKCTCIYSFSKKTTRELFAHHSSHVYSSWDARGMKWTPHLFFTTAPKNETLCHATLSFMDWAKFWQLYCRSSG